MLSVTYNGHRLYYNHPFTRFYKDRLGNQWSVEAFHALSNGLSHEQLYQRLSKPAKAEDRIAQLLQYCYPVVHTPDREGMTKAVNQLKKNTLHWTLQKLLTTLVQAKLVYHRVQVLIVETTAKKTVRPYVSREVGKNQYQLTVPLYDVTRILSQIYKMDSTMRVL